MRAPIVHLTCFLSFLSLSLCLTTVAPAVEYGRYSMRGATTIPESVAIEGAEAVPEEVYRVLADRPAYYEISAPAGTYRGIVHYLKKDPADGEFAVEVNGTQVVPPTPCFYRIDKKDPVKTLQAGQVQFEAQAGADGPLVIRFPRDYDAAYAIAGIELLGNDGAFRINCGADKEMTDAQGNTWLADQELPIEEVTGGVTIQLDPNDTKNAWVDIGTEMVEKLKAAGADPLPKWGGTYTRHVNAVIVDRSGNIYINFAAVGLWNYGGPGGTLVRADGGIFNSVAKGEVPNPYGPGFVLFCSHGYNPKETYQALSWDGVTIQTWPSDADFGAVDWTHEGTPLIFSKPRHNTILVISKDGGQTQTEVAKQEDIVNLGALGDGVLVYCVGDRKGENPDNGIYRSEDEGQTWTRVVEGVNAWSNANCSNILAYENRAYLQTAEGLYKSADRGKTWRLIPDSPAFEGAPLPGKDDSHLLAFSREGGFESFDQGETWKKVMPVPPDAEKWLQSHSYFNFAWDHVNNVVFAYAPDAVYRFVRE